MNARHNYAWPDEEGSNLSGWRMTTDERARVRDLPETPAEISADSRWPAFFPVSLSIATAAHGGATAMERITGASIVNRFPYILAISVCREDLSRRHHARRTFMRLLEGSGHCAIQFPTPGRPLDIVLDVLAQVSEDQSDQRIAATELTTRRAVTGPSVIFDDSYLVYEGRLAEPTEDLEGHAVFPSPWIDVGSHRLYFLEVTAIQLRREIAAGDERIRWCGLPSWNGEYATTSNDAASNLPASRINVGATGIGSRYIKSYTPHYEFPSAGTVGFEPNGFGDGIAIRALPKHAADQIEVNDDRARWPCFFPSSVGMITTWADPNTPNLMPCGSTTVVSRSPLVIAPCVSYAKINQRYAPRATLDIIRRTGRFGCGVPFLRADVVSAIRVAGTRSIIDDPHKVSTSGLEVQSSGPSPVLPALPIHFDCEVTAEVRMGTHVMFLGEARRIRVRRDVHAANPITWCPWADVTERSVESIVGVEKELASG